MKINNLTERDLKIIRFIWRWKMSTTATIRYFFYSKSQMKVAYERLRKLKKYGFLRIILCPSGEEKVWTLTQKSFPIIKRLYGEMKQKGFQSESPSHDMKVNIMQIGLFDHFDSSRIGVVSEQELRRLSSDCWPKNVPKEGHRPDGYWNIYGKPESRLIALELEISAKTKLQYTEIGYHYHLEEQVKSVIWGYENSSLAGRIYSVLQGVSGRGKHKNNFVSLNEFMEKGAESKVTFGSYAGQEMSKIFEEQGAIKLRNPRGTFLTQALKDGRICARNH